MGTKSVSHAPSPGPLVLMEPPMRNTLFVILWVFIAAVSAIDAYLAVEYASVLVEENPIGRWLIAQDGVALLVAVKFFGTSLALGILLALRRTWIGMPVACGVAILQSAVLCYLML